MTKTFFKRSLNVSLLFLAVSFFVSVLVLRSWVNDDAYITMRVVDNFVNGYGPRWNIADRVQVFTHPLWMLLVSGVYFFTREAYLTVLSLSWVLSVMAVWMFQKAVGNFKLSALAVLLLGLSTAYVDYSTSGLENSLGHLLAMIFVWIFFTKEDLTTQRRVFSLSLITSLALTTRHDYLLIYALALGFELYKAAKQLSIRTVIKLFLLGMLPLLAWEIFSTIYYGFPLPNTYYAKTGLFVSLPIRATQALHFFEYSLRYDPITLILIFSSVVLGLTQPKLRLLSLGVLLYLVYLVNIGGDFMGGRFFSLPYVISVVVLVLSLEELFKVRFRRLGWTITAAAVLAVIVMQILIAKSPSFLPYAKGFETANHYGIQDQRMLYAPTSFIKSDEVREYWHSSEYTDINKVKYLVRIFFMGELHRTEPNHDFIRRGKTIHRRSLNGENTPLVIHAAGFIGYYAGPQVHLIDELALGDAFLAQLPPINITFNKIGHYDRLVLPDYESVIWGELDRIEEPASAGELYREIQLITRGPLFTWERFKTIAAINLRPKYSRLSPEAFLYFRFPVRFSAQEGDWVIFSDPVGGEVFWIDDPDPQIELQVSGYRLFVVEQISSEGKTVKTAMIRCKEDPCIFKVKTEGETSILVVYPSKGYHLTFPDQKIKIRFQYLADR
jgi:arabinofuranosyltransferase